MGIIQTATTVKKVDNTKGLKAGLCGLGGLAFAGCVLTPNESFLTTHVVLIVSTVALMVYNVQFMLVPEMLLTQNFQVDGKVDKYHKFCCRLAGSIGTIGALALWACETGGHSEKAYKLLSALIGGISLLGPMQAELTLETTAMHAVACIVMPAQAALILICLL